MNIKAHWQPRVQGVAPHCCDSDRVARNHPFTRICTWSDRLDRALVYFRLV
jgi:hypothetical protein